VGFRVGAGLGVGGGAVGIGTADGDDMTIGCDAPVVGAFETAISDGMGAVGSGGGAPREPSQKPTVMRVPARMATAAMPPTSWPEDSDSISER
jgi:hypothetical protein